MRLFSTLADLEGKDVHDKVDANTPKFFYPIIPEGAIEQKQRNACGMHQAVGFSAV